MIDYLEELLQEETLELPSVEGRRSPKEEEKEGETAERKGVAVSLAMSDLQRALQQGSLAAEGASIAADLQGEWQVVGLPRSDIRLAADVRMERSDSLYETLHHAARAAQFIGEAAAPERILSVSAAMPSGLDIAAVDRAVERDARRYDSGFSLY